MSADINKIKADVAAQGAAVNTLIGDVKAAQSQIVLASQFGLKPELADCTKQLYAANAFMRTLQSPIYFVFDIPGWYGFLQNPLSCGLVNATIDGNGSQFQNINTANPNNTSGVNDAWWTNTGMQQTIDPLNIFKEIAPITTYCPIQSATIGDRKITFVNPTDALKFTIRGWLQLGGWIQQDGDWPQNWRYCEYARIQSIELKDGKPTGVIFLASPLQNSYDSRWFCGGQVSSFDIGCFALPVSRTGSVFTEYLKLKNIELLGNATCGTVDVAGIPSNLTASLTVSNCNHFEAEEVYFDHLVVTQTNTAKFTNCHGVSSEPDKQVDRVVFEDCSIISIGDATGVNEVRVTGCRIGGPKGGGVNVASRRLFGIGNTLIGGASIGPQGFWPNQLVVLSDNVSESQVSPVYLNSLTAPFKVTVKSVASLNQFRVDGSIGQFISTVQVGSVLRTANGSTRFVVSNVTYDSLLKEFVVDGIGTSLLKSGDSLQYYCILNYTDRDNVSAGAFVDSRINPALNGLSVAENVNLHGGLNNSGRVMVIAGPNVGTFNRTVAIDARIQSLMIVVDKAFTGKSTVPNLILRQESMSNPDWFTVSLDKVGVYQVPVSMTALTALLVLTPTMPLGTSDDPEWFIVANLVGRK